MIDLSVGIDVAEPFLLSDHSVGVKAPDLEETAPKLRAPIGVRQSTDGGGYGDLTVEAGYLRQARLDCFSTAGFAISICFAAGVK